MGSPAAGLAASRFGTLLVEGLAQGLAALAAGLAAGLAGGSNPCGKQSGSGTSCVKYNFSLAKIACQHSQGKPVFQSGYGSA